MSIPNGSPGAAATYSTGVLVVGGGIAGLSAAVSAREAGADVILIEKAPREAAAGTPASPTPRCASPTKPTSSAFATTRSRTCTSDLMRISRGRANPDLIRTLCENARQTAEWLTGMGLEWEAGYPHTAGYRRSPKSGGAGLVDLLFRRLDGLGGIVAYETGAMDLIVRDDGSSPASARAVPRASSTSRRRGGVVLACGGFQANVQMRVRYLGRFADSLILRGSRYNTGEGL